MQVERGLLSREFFEKDPLAKSIFAFILEIPPMAFHSF